MIFTYDQMFLKLPKDSVWTVAEGLHRVLSNNGSIPINVDLPIFKDHHCSAITKPDVFI